MPRLAFIFHTVAGTSSQQTKYSSCMPNNQRMHHELVLRQWVCSVFRVCGLGGFLICWDTGNRARRSHELPIPPFVVMFAIVRRTHQGRGNHVLVCRQ